MKVVRVNFFLKHSVFSENNGTVDIFSRVSLTC